MLVVSKSGSRLHKITRGRDDRMVELVSLTFNFEYPVMGINNHLAGFVFFVFSGGKIDKTGDDDDMPLFDQARGGPVDANRS